MLSMPISRASNRIFFLPWFIEMYEMIDLLFIKTALFNFINIYVNKNKKNTY